MQSVENIPPPPSVVCKSPGKLAFDQFHLSQKWRQIDENQQTVSTF